MRGLLLFLAVFCPAIYAFPEQSPVMEFEPVVGGLKGTSGITTRYWDCCKPACAWDIAFNNTKITPVRICAKDGVTKLPKGTDSACDRQKAHPDAFTCNEQQPWAINSKLAYGFASFSSAGGIELKKCCTCMKLDFQGQLKGKTMIVQIVNTGEDLHGNHFDIALPGGGVGIYNACDVQWGASKDGWGDRYGGVHTRAECDSLLPAPLRKGCHFRFDFLEGASNPDVIFEEVTCPKAITKITECVRV